MQHSPQLPRIRLHTGIQRLVARLCHIHWVRYQGARSARNCACNKMHSSVPPAGSTFLIRRSKPAWE